MVWPPYFNETIEAGDVVMLRGGIDELAALQDELKLKLFNEARFDAKSMQFYELAVTPQSALLGRQIGDLHLWRDFGAITVAVLRNNQHIRERASKQVLQAGDLLLVCGDDNSQARLRASSDFYLLTGAQKRVLIRGKARRALAIIVALMAFFSALSMGGRSDLLPIAAIGGAVAMVATGCLHARRAYRAIDWSILMFLVGTIGLGRAMENSGVASLAAGGIVHLLDGIGPLAIFAGLTLMCALLSSVISNQAVAVLLTPIALSAAGTIALESGLPAEQAAAMTRAFLLGIALSASICFATPIGHQSSLMVYGPGGYRWSDFLRIGVPVSLLAWVAILLLVPMVTGGF
jgi:di/tricarboxylate transporter